jgi:hypothetical protein
MSDNRRLFDEARSSITLLRTMMDPTSGKTEMVPDVDGSSAASFAANVDYSLTFNVQAAPTLPQIGTGPAGNVPTSASDFAPFSTGLYMAFPSMSVDSVYHMGIVPGGPNTIYNIPANQALQYATNNLRGFDFRGKYVGQPSYNGAPPDVLPRQQISYYGDVVLPRVGAGNGIQIAPDLAENYSMVRAFAGKMAISSSTISGTNFNLAGTLSSAVISDTRDIAAVKGANGIYRAFPVASLAQQSVTRGDVLRASSIYDGAVDLIGPDYSRVWTQPNVAATDRLDAEYRIMPCTHPYRLTLSQTATAAWSFVQDVAQTWITPTKTSVFVADGTSAGLNQPINWGVMETPSINEDGVLDIDVDLTICVRHNSAIGANQSEANLEYKFFFNFCHVFAYIGNDGFVQYNIVAENETHLQSSIETYKYSVQWGTAFDSSQPVMRVSKKARPRMLRNGFATPTGGKYLGTLVSTSYQLINIGGLPGATIFTVDTSNLVYRVRARSVDAPGRIGPCHLIRYDDVAVGQQIQMQGMAIVQGVPLGNLAPFVQKQTGLMSVPDSSFSKFIDVLWGRAPMFRRITTLKNYIDHVLPYIRDLSADGIMDVLNELDPAEKTIAVEAGKSAGFFSNLLGSVGNAIVPGLGGAIGAGLGGVGDHLLGTGSGQFGYGEAAGAPQFGAAAGAPQFGAAGGQFGYGSAAGRRQRL